jgi:hypothetical protein
MKVPCYTTRTGIQIGSRYDPPPPVIEMSRDEFDLQTALLNKPERSILEEILVAFGAAALALIFVLTLIKMWRF